MGSGKEVFKARHCTLYFQLSKQVSVANKLKWTWRRSSKSRPAVQFMLDAFLENLWIVPLPCEGTRQYLRTKITDLVMWERHTTHLKLNLSIVEPPLAYRICSKCVNIAFQTPSSNSWRRSTTKRTKKLNASSEIFSVKAFWWCS